MFDAWKQRQRQRLENRPERTVFYNIFATMMLVLAVELLMAAASILAVNVTGQLDKNAKDLLTMRVRNRASYVQEILRNAEDLEQLSEQITATTQQLLKSGDISLDTLDNGSEQSDALLVALAPQLLDTLRTKQVTGIFLILNTHDLDTCEVGKKMPGIYLRDLDPDARPSERNSDLLLERASATVVKELAIGTDKGWQPAFPYQGDTKGGILRTVFQTAYKGDAGLSAESYGRWTTNSYCLAGDDRHAIAYSMPLILPDGTVYGVVGVELLTDYLQTKLPFTELDEDKAGTYFIVTTTDDALTDGVLTLRKTVTSGEDLVTADAPLGVLNCRSNGKGGNWVELNDKRYYMVLEPLQVYNRNAPFAAEKWFLAGTMEQSVLLAFSSRVREVLRDEMTYTETPSEAPGGEDPLTWFLTGGREGNAVQYASAAAMALRAHGIPARYCEGYLLTAAQVQAAEGGAVTLTGANAHAWCEAYFDGVGWLPVDVTPGFYYDALALQQLVAMPDSIRRTAAMEDAGDAAGEVAQTDDSGADRPDGLLDGTVYPPELLLGVLALLLILASLAAAALEGTLLLCRVRVLSGFKHASPGQRVRLLAWWGQRILAARGVEATIGWHTEETDAMLAEMIDTVNPGEYRRVCGLLEKAIYGGIALKVYEERAAYSLLDRLYHAPAPDFATGRRLHYLLLAQLGYARAEKL